MQKECFSPMLALTQLQVDDIDEALAILNAQEKPMTIHMFTKSHHVHKRFVEETSSRAWLCNDGFLHVSAIHAK